MRLLVLYPLVQFDVAPVRAKPVSVPLLPLGPISVRVVSVLLSASAVPWLNVKYLLNPASLPAKVVANDSIISA